MRIQHPEELTALPDPGGVWSRDPDLHDPDDVRAVMEETRAAADRISTYRSQIHDRLDAATDELVKRYQSDRSAILRLLDQR